ncbi:GNAT family N-acetyltransferase [Afipia sp. TerB]
MLAFRPEDFSSFADVVRIGDGRSVIVRFVEAPDGDAVQAYFRNLSAHARHNRFLGGASELPPHELRKILHVGEGNHFAVVVEAKLDGVSAIIGEARYVADEDSGAFEFGMSVTDAWQRQGVGAALIANLECRAAALGAMHMIGDTLRSNVEMIALARKSGFRFVATPGDWQQVRFVKDIRIAPLDIPCANWKRAALAAMTPARVTI